MVRRTVALDAPVGSKSADYIEPVMSRRAARPRGPRTTVVLDFDMGMVAWRDSGADGEGATWQARAAVEGSVGSEFGGAEDHLVCNGAVPQ